MCFGVCHEIYYHYKMKKVIYNEKKCIFAKYTPNAKIHIIMKNKLLWFIIALLFPSVAVRGQEFIKTDETTVSIICEN